MELRILNPLVTTITRGATYGTPSCSAMPKQIGAQKLIKKLSEKGVRNLRQVSANSVSGATLQNNTEALGILKDFGIDTVVDFRSEAAHNYAKVCQNCGLNYFSLPLEQTAAKIPGIVDKDGRLGISDDFVGKLKQFIHIYNKDNVYMGCHYGIDRTNLGLVLNYLLNPQAEVPQILSWSDMKMKAVINKTLKTARKIIKKMTKDQRAQFDLQEDYSENFQDKIGQLIKKNSFFNN